MSADNGMDDHLKRLLDGRYPKGWRVHEGTIEAKQGRAWKRVATVGGRLPGRPRSVRGEKVTVYMSAVTKADAKRWGTESGVSAGIRRAFERLRELGIKPE